MPNNKFWSIAEFARFSHISKYSLLNYDEIGLLSPIKRGANNYRYYHSSQIVVVKIIRTFQRLGMTLGEIKEIKDRKTPELANQIFQQQMVKIDANIDDWVSAKKLLHTLQQTIDSALNIDEDRITIQYLPAEAVILGGLNDYSRGRDNYDALSSFYHEMSKKYPGLDLNYLSWGYFSEERIKSGDWVWPDRYYFFNPEGHDRKPAAFYAVGFSRGGYGQSGNLYKRLIEYIDQQGFEICGGAYEEYPLNEVCISDESNYLIRVMITVRQKKKYNIGA